MYIKNVNCEQFGGINNINKDFKPGMNVIAGANESGKSTLAEFIYHALFTSYKETNKNFKEKCFPNKVAGSKQINTISGSVSFVGDDSETYKIEKVWDNGSKSSAASCKLTKPTGIENNLEAQETIKELLRYGAGVYKENIFSSQRDPKNIIGLLLFEPTKQEDIDAKKKQRMNLSTALSAVALETAGVPSKKLSDAIKKEYGKYCKGWDIKNNRSSGAGSGMLKEIDAELNKLNENKKNIEATEIKYDTLTGQCETYKKQKIELEKKLNDYEKYSDAMELRDNKLKEKKVLEEKLRKERPAQKQWPKYVENLNEANILQQQLVDAKIISDYNYVKGLKDIYEKEDAEFKSMKEVEDSDIKLLEDLEEKIDTEENKLRSMNISFDISKIDHSAAELKYYQDNKKINVEAGDSIPVDRPVVVKVEDKLEMTIRQSDVNIKEVEKTIANAREDYENKCKEFGCNTKEALKDLKKKYENKKTARDNAIIAYEKALADIRCSWSALEAKRDGTTSTLDEDAVYVHIEKLCGDHDLQKHISDWKAVIGNYEEEYTDFTTLDDNIKQHEKDVQDIKDEISQIKIPANVAKIDVADTESRISDLKTKIDDLEIEITPLSGALQIYDPVATYNFKIEEKEKEFEDAQIEAQRWYDILNKFNEVLTKTEQMDVTSLEKNFKAYLSRLTNNRVTVDNLNNSLELEVSSNDNQLKDYILSVGTRESIELAFRLAMIDELFPNGKGFAFFDDSIVNMDPERTEAACSLLRDFADRHQIIFVTCHPEYAKLLGVDDKDIINI